ncbi:peptidoglycan-binding protein [Leucobacter sp. UT-8R-CII-1-4]|uniref:peptidoglycan-binding protein n=1 Tax=Leucobacter sp. UT-8R-CII-1-4 TaxID=3040075 RepID=UPI0024A9A1B3|nr:peptidoglycan-binding protein [Leucobacter sp. UT-8R-CII-1-4]MDI6022710.1 peptidoglycan-binding protein [Leucobacter sp. UT-8R-CII-1-4]
MPHAIELESDIDRSEVSSTKKKPKRLLVISISAVCLLAVVGGGAFAYASFATPSESAVQPATKVSTESIQSGQLKAETTVPGTLDFAAPASMLATTTGTLTYLPSAGAVLHAGEAIYRADQQPVILMTGAMPAWRDFEPGMNPGDDVTQLQQNLGALGYFDGEADGRYTWGTREAVYDWKKDVGFEPDYSLSRSSIIFASGSIRIDSIEPSIGSSVAPGTKLFGITSPSKMVTADVPIKNAEIAVAGTPVTIDLPNGSSTTGTIASVGSPTERTQDNKKTVVLPISVALSDQEALGQLTKISVTLHFEQVVREDVLSVSVDALVPIAEGKFALELPRKSADAERKLLPVELGIFAADRVEVSGKGIKAGLEVTVPVQ